MINIKIVNKNNYITNIEITGHAGYDVRGRDIICSAVSSLTYNLIFGLNNVLRANCNINIKSGDVKIELNEKTSKDAYLLTKSFQLTILEMEKSHNKYIKLEEIHNE